METLHEKGFRCDILEDKICDAEQQEFWEKNFLEKQTMWGLEPARSAVLTKDFFLQSAVKSVLIPGIGYGRNAQVFREAGMTVAGIEISKTAIELARKHYGSDMVIHHGSVTDMPFDDHRYDGVFCYALIHLLDEAERAKLIRDCYRQLTEGGCMVFTVISKDSPTYGQGTPVGKDRFEMFGGVRLFFYDRERIETEFGGFGLFKIMALMENYPFWLVKCRKGN
ncbi:MAG: class I SAM-dependent methyltransferase [Saprospiraceae bacterium]|nr:class I SAM-dependent methyltransferase [Saprospiraceae bacterium]